jgi:dynein heavy chain
VAGLDCRWARRAKLGDALCEKLPGIVAATIEVYNTIRAELLPTPAKSHYLYNMRDLSKLFQVRCDNSLTCI